jgi:hypothetical protein
MRPFSCAALILALGYSNLAAQAALPDPVASGLESLKGGQCANAFDLWTNSWTDPGEAGNRDQLRGSCAYLSKLGELRGIEILDRPAIGVNIAYTYVTLLYEKQPVFMLLVAYRPATEWKVMTVNWNTDAMKVLPAKLLPPGPVASPR